MQIELNRKQAPDVFKATSIFGSKYVTKNAKVQFAEKAIDEPSLFASGENISAFNVQAKGPNPIENATENENSKFKCTYEDTVFSLINLAKCFLRPLVG